MKHWAIGSLIGCVVVSLAQCVLAAEQETPPPTAALAGTNVPASTLEALVADVSEHNSELNFYRAEITIAKAGRKTAGLFPNPELSGSVGQKTMHGEGIDGEGIAWSASIMQPFEWPGRIGLRKAIANRDIALADLGYERFKTALAGRTRSLAFGLFAARERATAAGEVAERFQALREVLVQRDPAGLTPLLETRVIEATELTMQHKASEATLAAQTALLELNQLRGVASDSPFSIITPQLDFHPVETLQTLLGMARTNNFELRVRTVELAQQGFRVDLAKNERFPAISVGPTVSVENAGDRERIIGLGVSLPLPLWNRNGGNIAAAKARQSQAETSLLVTQREIDRKVVEAALIYKTRLGEMERWRPDSVAHFKEAADLADRHYRLGAVPITIYVELQKQYLEAVESLLDRKKEALEAAQQLELLTGLPLPLTSTPGEKR